ncbi:nuclear envelope pore membrane protein POM 121 [Neolamprologus brichardi]|uniref:nuclear envelope pore membrane protein POM 121 n=1 Tax=Neolamprologus brichardi TaxID=32507 RepID=UPI0003EC4CDD|nr:nuclear envelope pore membrane protein POM 121 [Neolamprologus brichardi]
MRVLRRRVAAMSPREKHLLLLSALGLVTLAFYYIPTFLYVTLILAVCCIVCYYHSGEPLPARLGPNPRGGLNVPAVLRRWLWSWEATGVSVPARGRAKSSGSNRAELRESEGHLSQRLAESGVYRKESLSSESFLFSPRDFLMGSYIGKPESPTADSGRRRAVRNPREQLREKLARPNHAVYTPNRRLSFAGETPGAASRFTITPQRHYPLQQPGVSSVGILPPVKWDGFRKKNILSPRNSPAALSPVTVKIARPDHSSPRRNDSGGSAHSAFEPLLPNGTPSQLVPKPGSLKRGMTSVTEESIMKRSRTSSISSGSGAHAPRGTPGTRRNAIQSSYSSSLGLNQWKKPSAPSSPLSSPGSSRCQTPEGISKRPREDDTQSPSSASSAKSDHTSMDNTLVSFKLAPLPKVHLNTSSDSGGSGKRKRKIQLVSSNRDDHISLPPPPELGYTVTVKDLDEEKRAAISKIQKVLETPAPEPEKTVSPSATTSTLPAPSAGSTATATTSTTTLSSLLAAPLPTSSSATPVINLDPNPVSSAGTVPAAPNPLLEALKKASAPSPTSATSASSVSVSTTPAQPSVSILKASTTVASPQIPAVSQSSSVGVQQSSAFAQVLLGQVSQAASSTPPMASLFGVASQVGASSASSTSNSTAVTAAPASSSASVSNTNPLMASGFKPIFAVTATTTTTSATSASENKPPVQNFKPIFGDATAATGFGQPPSLASAKAASTISSTSSTASVFGGSTSSNTAGPSLFSGLTTTTTTAGTSTGSLPTSQPAPQPAMKSLFGNWNTTSTTSTTNSALNQAQNAVGTIQFGTATTTTAAATAPAPGPATASTTTSSQGTFAFGATQPDAQAASQKVFTFGQAARNQNTTTASFGGFAMGNTVSTAAPATTQSTCNFGKSSFEAPAAQTTFGSTAAAPKPFTFGGSGASSTPASNPSPAPFNFGATPTTTAATFGTPAKPAFGASTAGFAFGGTAAPSAAPSAPPSFGAATQAQSSSTPTFGFGSAAPQPAPSGPAQPASGGFNFGSGMPCPQFGTPVSNNPAPQMGSFNFGAAATDKPAFGTSTPSFGQSAAGGPIPFGSPGTPLQGFNAVQFGSPATPSFSIGAGSKTPGARQRLQARRQHNRKK